MESWYGLLGVPILFGLAFVWCAIEQHSKDKDQRKWDKRFREYDKRWGKR